MQRLKKPPTELSVDRQRNGITLQLALSTLSLLIFTELPFPQRSTQFGKLCS